MQHSYFTSQTRDKTKSEELSDHNDKRGKHSFEQVHMHTRTIFRRIEQSGYIAYATKK